jgi:hypothetical protein
MDTVQVVVTTCVGIEDPNAGYAVSVFPNPAQAEFKIRVEGIKSAQNAIVEITDLTGRTIFSQQLGIISGDFEHTLNATQFSKGSYLVRLSVGDNRFVRNLVIR